MVLLFKTGSDQSDTICFLRQFVTSVISYQLVILCGFSIGYTAYVLPQIEDDDSMKYDVDTGSWIASVAPLSMSLGSILAGGILDKFGRKLAHVLIAIPTIISWLLLGFAQNTTMLIIARAINGISAGATRPVTLVYVSELTDPKYRGIALTFSSLTINIGILLIHVITYYIHWKTSSLITAGMGVIILVLTLFIKESPIWLLKHNRDHEAVTVFQKFRGTNANAEKELNIMIEKSKIGAVGQTFMDKLKIVFTLKFLKPFTVAVFVGISVQYNGINNISYYSEEIFKKTFQGSIDPFLMTTITDVVKLFVILFVCILVKFIDRKLLYLTCGFLTVFVLICLIAFLYFSSDSLLWLLTVLIILYVCLATSMVGIGWSLVSEIMPADIRGIGTGLSSALYYLVLFVCVKVSPEIMFKFGLVSLFAMNASVVLICCLVLSFITPRTDGKTLQEIEDQYERENKK